MKRALLMILTLLTLAFNGWAQEDEFVDQSFSEYQEEFEAPESQAAYQQPANGAEYQTQEEKISPDPAEFEKNGAPPVMDDEFSSDYTEEY